MKLFLTPREVWEREGYGGKCAIVGVLGAMVFAIIIGLTSGDDDEVATSDPIVTFSQSAAKLQPELPGALPEEVANDKPAYYGVAEPQTYGYSYIVVKSGTCYTVGTNDDSGWIVNECFTRERATDKANGMNGIRTKATDFSNKTWTVVE